MVRAKFRVSTVRDDTIRTSDGEKKVAAVHLCPVYSGGEENKQFFNATPAGDITLYTINEAAAKEFVVGGEYYVDFTRVGQ